MRNRASITLPYGLTPGPEPTDHVLCRTGGALLIRRDLAGPGDLSDRMWVLPTAYILFTLRELGTWAPTAFYLTTAADDGFAVQSLLRGEAERPAAAAGPILPAPCSPGDEAARKA